MKKVLAIILVMVMVLSMCACNNASIDEKGNKTKMKNGDIVLDIESDFVITEKAWSAKYAKVGKTDEYIAVLKNDEYALILEIGPEEYAVWEEEDIVHGHLTSTYIASHGSDVAKLIIEESEYRVEWYGQIEG